MSGDYKRFLQDKEKELQVNVPCVDGVWNKESDRKTVESEGT